MAYIEPESNTFQNLEELVDANGLAAVLTALKTVTFGTSLGAVQSASLIQSNFSTAGNGPGNLAVVSVANGELHYLR